MHRAEFPRMELQISRKFHRQGRQWCGHPLHSSVSRAERQRCVRKHFQASQHQNKPHCEIFNDDDCTGFRMAVTNYYQIQFNVDYLPPVTYKWFCEVVGRQIRKAISITQKTENDNVKSEIRKALGL